MYVYNTRTILSSDVATRSPLELEGGTWGCAWFFLALVTGVYVACTCMSPNQGFSIVYKFKAAVNTENDNDTDTIITTTNEHINNNTSSDDITNNN